MNLPKRTPELEIRELGGEPLEGSGFEAEEPATGVESGEWSVAEGINQ
jgi:hypothetical protein